MTPRRLEPQVASTSRRRLALVLVAAAALAGGCRGAASPDAGASVTVSAASSLRDAFSELGAVAEGEGLDVTFNFDSSSSLAAQIIEGAPADVYASAAPEDMTRLEDAGLVRDPVAFARNVLAIVTPPGNPRRIASLADLAGVGVVSLCGPDVPCGRYAQRALEAAGVVLPDSSVTRAQNAAAALTAVAEGDAAAGVVYATDARSAGDQVATVPIRGADELAATYLVAVLDGSGGAARAFVDLIGSERGQEVLQEHGFLRVG